MWANLSGYKVKSVIQDLPPKTKIHGATNLPLKLASSVFFLAQLWRWPQQQAGGAGRGITRPTMYFDSTICCLCFLQMLEEEENAVILVHRRGQVHVTAVAAEAKQLIHKSSSILSVSLWNALCTRLQAPGKLTPGSLWDLGFCIIFY